MFWGRSSGLAEAIEASAGPSGLDAGAPLGGGEAVVPGERDRGPVRPLSPSGRSRSPQPQAGTRSMSSRSSGIDRAHARTTGGSPRTPAPPRGRGLRHPPARHGPRPCSPGGQSCAVPELPAAGCAHRSLVRRWDRAVSPRRVQRRPEAVPHLGGEPRRTLTVADSALRSRQVRRTPLARRAPGVLPFA